MSTSWVTLRLPAAPYAVGIARTMVLSSAGVAGLADDRIDDVRLAVSEAVTNAVQAHRRVQSVAPVVVRTAVDGTRFVVEVGDAGPGLAVDASADPLAALAADDDLGGLDEGGFGIPVMRSLADTFDVLPGGLVDRGNGTTIRMAFDGVGAVGAASAR